MIIGYISLHSLLVYAKLVVATATLYLSAKRLGDYGLLFRMCDLLSYIYNNIYIIFEHSHIWLYPIS